MDFTEFLHKYLNLGKIYATLVNIGIKKRLGAWENAIYADVQQQNYIFRAHHAHYQLQNGIQ